MTRRASLGALLLLFATVASAQDTADETGRYVGHFVLDGSEEAARERIRRALEPAIQSIPFLFRSMATERLNARFRVVRAIDIELPADRISVRYTGERTRTLESRRGHPVTIETDDGGEARMTQLFRDGHLEQVFEGEHGRMYRLLELSEDGARMTATTILQGGRLEQPIRITQPYVRR
ncbi:MAG: hypothetical protein H6719_26985 [Sandaracinaceae bacterium]|nr:hypothetical protein [Sandaracinaceae bacterium]